MKGSFLQWKIIENFFPTKNYIGVTTLPLIVGDVLSGMTYSAIMHDLLCHIFTKMATALRQQNNGNSLEIF